MQTNKKKPAHLPFWIAALGVGGIATVALFVAWSLAGRFLGLQVFSRLSAQQTFEILAGFIVVGAVVTLVINYLWYRLQVGRADSAQIESAKSVPKVNGSPSEAQLELLKLVTAAGISKIVPARRYYAAVGSTFEEHVQSCCSSFTMVSINLMTGIDFHSLLAIMRNKLLHIPHFEFTVSLLNPDRGDLMNAMALNIVTSPDVLASGIRDSLGKMMEFRTRELPQSDQRRMRIRVHEVIPFASAIIKDHKTDKGSLQIETKIYKANVGSSFAIEFVPNSESKLYETLVRGYNQLIEDGREWESVNTLKP